MSGLKNRFPIRCRGAGLSLCSIPVGWVGVGSWCQSALVAFWEAFSHLISSIFGDRADENSLRAYRSGNVRPMGA